MFIILIGFILQPKEADNKPKIDEFIITPENPLAKEPFSLHIKATDEGGLQSIGFEVKGTSKKEYFNCSGKICEHIWQLEAPPREGTSTFTAFAVDSKNQKAEQQKVIRFKSPQIPAEKCVSWDGICSEGCTYEQDSDCEKPMGGLEGGIKNASSVVWMGPHGDDKVYVTGLLAMSSLDYGKKTSVWMIGVGKGNPVENQRVKDLLGLYGYIHVGDNVDIIAEKLKQKKPDVIITFEPTNGYGNLVTQIRQNRRKKRSKKVG